MCSYTCWLPAIIIPGGSVRILGFQRSETVIRHLLFPKVSKLHVHPLLLIDATCYKGETVKETRTPSICVRSEEQAAYAGNVVELQTAGKGAVQGTLLSITNAVVA